MKTRYFTKLSDGWYLAPVGKRPMASTVVYGGTRQELIDFAVSEVGRTDAYSVWIVCNGCASVLSEKLSSIQKRHDFCASLKYRTVLGIHSLNY
jgi:hypothetical protein